MSTEKRKKVGIMGGTFDPIHIGHLILGENAYQQFDLDYVLFMPSGNPPHKKGRIGQATVTQRAAMVELAIKDNAHFKLSLIETHDAGYTYTKNTLKRLKCENPNVDYYFIMGADSLFHFETWVEPEEICKLCTIIAAVRDDVSHEQMDQQIMHLENTIGGTYLKMDTPNIDISSDAMRRHIRKGYSMRYYLPESVAEFIKSNKLYKECETK